MAEAPLLAYFDGLCEPVNPGGHMCGGYHIVGNRIVEPSVGSAHFGQGDGATNNVAEYQAALLVLRRIYKAGWRGPVILRGDSQLVCRHYSGQYQCNAAALVPLLEKLHTAAACFAWLTLEWIPREENDTADEQSRLAYKDVTGRLPPERKKRG